MTATRRLALPAWVALLAVCVVVLHAAGDGALATPSLLSLPVWPAWLARTDPVVASFAIVRLAALIVAAYALAVTLLGAGARAVGAVSIVAVLDRMTAPALRSLLAAGVSVGMAGTPAQAFALPVRAAVAAQATAPSDTVSPASPAPTAVMHRLVEGDTGSPSSTAPADPVAVTPDTPAGIQPPPAAAPTPAESAAPTTGERWTVRRGDCFWTIAEAVLAKASGRPPSDGEIVPYWHKLIDANRSALVVPGNADLIFPGQVFALPPL
jgi:hypothetical protein